MRIRANGPVPGLDLDAIEQVLEAAPVSVGVVYGSYARGEQRADSDVDVAVAFDDSLSSLDRTRARLSLIRRLSDVLGMDDVDVVPLDGAPQSLVREILADGIVVVGSPSDVEAYADETDDGLDPGARRAAFDDVLAELERVV